MRNPWKELYTTLLCWLVDRELRKMLYHVYIYIFLYHYVNQPAVVSFFSLPSCLKLEQFLGDFPFPGGHVHAALRRDLDGKATLPQSFGFVFSMRKPHCLFLGMSRIILGRDETWWTYKYIFFWGEGTLGIWQILPDPSWRIFHSLMA